MTGVDTIILSSFYSDEYRTVDAYPQGSVAL